VKNRGLRFVCAPARVRVDSDRSVLTARIEPGTELQIPVNHFSGSYVCDTRTLAELRDAGRVVLRYVENPNGSVDDIAGIASPEGNVVGLMPHPERAVDRLVGSGDGAALLSALLSRASG
jgi:phosphoribosylformylglycinamidine synthase